MDLSYTTSSSQHNGRVYWSEIKGGDSLQHSRWHYPAQSHSNTVVSVSPEQAGWLYLGFEAYQLPSGTVWHVDALEDRETALVVLGGRCTVTSGSDEWRLGRRSSVWTGLPWALYLPPRHELTIQATTPLLVARGTAPAEGRYPPKLVTPEDVEIEIRGGRNVTRQINHIFKPDFPAERLLIVEVHTPAGNWSSYPPHKHDQYQPPDEVVLEEVYFYQVESPDGYAMQQLYTADRQLDEILVAHNGDLILVPYGYHPVVALPQARVYYLNILAGDVRSMAARDDPALAWIRSTWTQGTQQIALITEGEATRG